VDSGLSHAEYVDRLQVVRESMNRLRGRTFEALEGTALEDRQLDAVKRLVRRFTVDAQRDIESTLRKDPPAS
jgi:dsRNA-specific ribonuclease